MIAETCLITQRETAKPVKLLKIRAPVSQEPRSKSSGGNSGVPYVSLTARTSQTVPGENKAASLRFFFLKTNWIFLIADVMIFRLMSEPKVQLLMLIR